MKASDDMMVKCQNIGKRTNTKPTRATTKATEKAIARGKKKRKNKRIAQRH